jgi:hypothetical protein
VKNFVIGPVDTRAIEDDLFLADRLLVASEALLYTRLVDLFCWVRADEEIEAIGEGSEL